MAIKSLFKGKRYQVFKLAEDVNVALVHTVVYVKLTLSNLLSSNDQKSNS